MSILKHFCTQVGSVSYERQPIADHANNLASTIQGNLKRSLEAIGVVMPLPVLPMQPWMAFKFSTRCMTVLVMLPLYCRALFVRNASC